MKGESPLYVKLFADAEQVNKQKREGSTRPLVTMNQKKLIIPEITASFLSLLICLNHSKCCLFLFVFHDQRTI